MSKQEKINTEIPNENDDNNLDEINKQTAGPEDNEVNDPAKTLCKFEKKIADLERELDLAKRNESEAMLRARAEIENNRRRVNQEIEKAHKFALEKFSNELLPVIDNLERALEATDKTNPLLETTIEGLELTLKTFLGAIKRFGIEQINPENEALNPELHQAISVVDNPAHQSGHIINSIQKGYTLNGRLLRPAMVIVAK